MASVQRRYNQGDDITILKEVIPEGWELGAIKRYPCLEGYGYFGVTIKQKEN